MPDTLPDILYVLINSVLTNLSSRYYDPHLTNEKTSTKRLSNLSVVTELIGGGARIQPRHS